MILGQENFLEKEMETHSSIPAWEIPWTEEPQFSSVQFSAQSRRTFCEPVDCSTPGLPVYHQLPEFTQTHVY